MSDRPSSKQINRGIHPAAKSHDRVDHQHWRTLANILEQKLQHHSDYDYPSDDLAPETQLPMRGFFDDYPRFQETSKTASGISRLNFRYHLIIESNIEHIKGKRILDIASHDGRFSFAALVGGGAEKVIGIEPRERLVKDANLTFDSYGLSEDSYEFLCGDAFQLIGDLPIGSIDTVMVLGFLYHTARQYELFSLISKLGAKNIIIDSRVLAIKGFPIVLLKSERTRHDSQIWDAERSNALSSEPSAEALKMWAEEFGYSVAQISPSIPFPTQTQGYSIGRRVTMVATKE